MRFAPNPAPDRVTRRSWKPLLPRQPVHADYGIKWQLFPCLPFVRRARPPTLAESLRLLLRAMVEADISRFKRVIGSGLRSRTDRRGGTKIALAVGHSEPDARTRTPVIHPPRMTVDAGQCFMPVFGSMQHRPSARDLTKPCMAPRRLQQNNVGNGSQESPHLPATVDQQDRKHPVGGSQSGMQAT